jgi:hypothetical protein
MTKVTFLQIFVLLLLFASFGLYPRVVLSFSLSDVESFINGKIIYSGSESNLNISQPISGVWEIKAKNFPCTPGTSQCEPERYEIRFPRKISHIYGLGTMVSEEQVELSDFLDCSFSSGHLNYPSDCPPKPAAFEADIGRLRTPIFVLPTENLIIAYLQPEVKKLRLSREGQYGCPPQNTCLVLKKKEEYSEGSPAPLVLVKGNNLFETYSKYYQYLKQKGFFFKKPHWQVFGLNWETINEYGVFPNQWDILNTVLPNYEKHRLRLSTITIGSGYWDYGNDWNTQVGHMEKFERHPTNWPDLIELINKNWKRNYEIYTILGMRFHVHKPYLSTFLQRHPSEFSFWDRNYKAFLGESLLGGGQWQGQPGGSAVLFDTKDSQTILNYFNHLKQAYGNFKGIKEDVMIYRDQKEANRVKNTGDPNPINLPDNLLNETYKIIADHYKDFVIFGRNDWFGVGTDVQNGPGWIFKPTKEWRTAIRAGTDQSKYYVARILPTLITQVISGYPHPKSVELDFSPSPHQRGCGLSDQGEKELIRSYQLATFLPVTMHSCGFWNMKNSTYREIIFPFFSQLRMRLHQYAYDQAQKWYETGIPHLLQPLFFQWQNDPKVYEIYSYHPNDLNNYPRDEFMFGNALLVRPVYSDNDTFKVYLPGDPNTIWRYFLKEGKPALRGGQEITYTIETPYDYPVFIKEGEILIIGDPDVSKDPLPLFAYVFLETKNQSSIYYLYLKNGGKIRLQALKEGDQVKIKNLDNGREILTSDDPYRKGLKIANIMPLISPFDVNGDGIFNFKDIKTLLQKFFTLEPQADLNSDGKVNSVDFGNMIK